MSRDAERVFRREEQNRQTMLHKTRAISLNYLKYKDTSIIARMYTEEFGMQSYIVNRVRTKNSKFKIAHFQPFSLLELVCYHNEKKNIQRISEMKNAEPLYNIPFDVPRSSIALFLTEILVKIFREEQADREQFNFLYHSVRALDKIEAGINIFHLQFLMKLGRFIGITSPDAEDIIKEITLYRRDSMKNPDKLQLLMNGHYGDHIVFTKGEKQACFDAILTFYALHFDQLKELRSLSILKEVLN